MKNIDRRIEEISGYVKNSPVAVFTYADNSTRRIFRPSMKIMEAIANIDNPVPDCERVVSIESVVGEQADILISLFNLLITHRLEMEDTEFDKVM